MTRNRFQGKVAIVTGGASGMGLATARLYAAEGGNVVIADVADATAISEEIGKEHAIYARCDVGVMENVDAVVATCMKVFGRVDFLFNNAAIGVMGTVLDSDPDTWRRTIATDLDSVYFGCRAVIPHMLRQGGGAIVNTASISGLGGDYGAAAYNAAKGAVINLTRAMAVDFARRNIRVNAIAPGLIDTPLARGTKAIPALWNKWLEGIPMGRAGRAEEIARAVAFLASDDESFITGITMSIDGGAAAATGQPDLHPHLPELLKLYK